MELVEQFSNNEWIGLQTAELALIELLNSGFRFFDRECNLKLHEALAKLRDRPVGFTDWILEGPDWPSEEPEVIGLASSKKILD